jgi:hypothetical protein
MGEALLWGIVSIADCLPDHVPVEKIKNSEFSLELLGFFRSSLNSVPMLYRHGEHKWILNFNILPLKGKASKEKAYWSTTEKTCRCHNGIKNITPNIYNLTKCNKMDYIFIQSLAVPCLFLSRTTNVKFVQYNLNHADYITQYIYIKTEVSTM